MGGVTQATFISVLLVELVLVLSICRQVVANILRGICAYIHCVEDSDGDGDGGGGNAMLVMAVVMMRGGMPRRVVVMSGW